jgi:hypothetical protein
MKILLDTLSDTSRENKKILMNILEAYAGNMDKFLSLLDYSKIMKDEDEKKRL